jgi:hypothetical protein
MRVWVVGCIGALVHWPPSAAHVAVFFTAVILVQPTLARTSYIHLIAASPAAFLSALSGRVEGFVHTCTPRSSLSPSPPLLLLLLPSIAFDNDLPADICTPARSVCVICMAFCFGRVCWLHALRDEPSLPRPSAPRGRGGRRRRGRGRGLTLGLGLSVCLSVSVCLMHSLAA